MGALCEWCDDICDGMTQAELDADYKLHTQNGAVTPDQRLAARILLGISQYEVGQGGMG